MGWASYSLLKYITTCVYNTGLVDRDGPAAHKASKHATPEEAEEGMDTPPAAAEAEAGNNNDTLHPTE